MAAFVFQCGINTMRCHVIALLNFWLVQIDLAWSSGEVWVPDAHLESSKGRTFHGGRRKKHILGSFANKFFDVFHRKVLNFTSILDWNCWETNIQNFFFCPRKPWWRAMVWVQKDGLMKMKTRREFWRSCPAILKISVWPTWRLLETSKPGSCQWVYWLFLGCFWCCWETSGNDFSWIELGATILRMRMPLKVLAENCCNLRHRCFNQPELPSVQIWSPMTTWWLHGKTGSNLCQFSSPRYPAVPPPQARRESIERWYLEPWWQLVLLSLDSFSHNISQLPWTQEANPRLAGQGSSGSHSQATDEGRTCEATSFSCS